MDRRHHARSSPPGLAFVKIEPGMGGTMVDLCEGGLGFRVIMPLLDESGPVKISFSLDANSLLEASGEVAWADATKQHGGVRFTNIRDDVRAQLRDFLAKSILPVQPSEQVFSPAFNASAFTTLNAPLSGKPAQPSVSKADAPAADPVSTPPKAPAPGPMVVAPKVTPAPAADVEATPPKRAVPMKPRTTPAKMPFLNPPANQPAAQATSQASTNPASIPEFDAPASRQSPVAEQVFENAPRYQTPAEYGTGAPSTSRIASDSLLGKVQEIRPSRIAPPAQPTPAQAPPDMARRMAAAGAASASATSSSMASAAEVSLSRAAAVTRPSAPAQRVAATPPSSTLTSAPPPAAAQPPVAAAADTAAPSLAAASVAASPASSFKFPPAMSTSLASAEQYWRSVVLDPAKDLYQNREKFLSRLPEELRNKQFVGRTAGAGVVTAFVILLLLTTYNYFKSARAMSAQPATQVAQTQPIQPPPQAATSAANVAGTSSATTPAAATTPSAPAPAATSRRSDRTERASVASVSETSSGRAGSRSSSAHSDALPTSAAIQTDTTGNAELQLARHYLDGQGEDQNQTLAIQWLWSAVKKGNAQADMLLADMYLRGQGVTQNCEQSRVLLLAAANSGSSLAKQRLEGLDSEGCSAHSAQN